MMTTSEKLRDVVQKIQSDKIEKCDIIPLLLQAADELDTYKYRPSQRIPCLCNNELVKGICPYKGLCTSL